MDGATVTLGVRRTSVPLWAASAGVAMLLGAVLATSPLVLVLGGALIATCVLLVASAREPRWMLIVAIGLLYSYAGWVLGHLAGASEITVAILPLLVAVLAVRWALTRERPALPPETGALAALGVTLAVSVVVASDVGSALTHVADYAVWALLVTLMAALLSTPAWLRRALWVVAIAAAALAFVSLFQAATGAFDNDFLGFAKVDARGGTPRSAGPLQPNNFAQMLLVAGVIAWYLGLSARSRAGRAAGFVAAAACTAGIVATGSRGGLIALAVVFVGIVVLAPVPRRSLLTGAAVAVALAVLFVPGEYASRLSAVTGVFSSGVASADDTAVRGRASENLAAVQMFVDHPLLGVGAGNYPARYQEYSQQIGLDTRAEGRAPHNLYLEALAETGLVGTAVFLWVLWLALRGAWRARTVLRGPDRLLAEGAFLGICGYLTAGFFLHGAYPRYLWIVVGVGVAAGGLATLAAGPARAPRPAPRPRATTTAAT